MVANPDETDPEDKTRVYNYDELNGQVQAVSFVSGPVCYERDLHGGNDAIEVVDVTTGDEVWIVKVNSPQGELWIDDFDWNYAEQELVYSEKYTGPEDYAGLTLLNEYNDFSNIRQDESEAPRECEFVGCSV